MTEPGVVYHLLNRDVMRLTMFSREADYRAFERVPGEGVGAARGSAGRI